MKIKIFETIETIIEMPDKEFDDDPSDCEIATEFFEAVEKGTGKLLYENRQYCDGNDNEIISWSTNVWVYDEKTKQEKSVSIEEYIKESDNGKPKIQIRHDLFIPWIHDDYDQNDIVEAWGGGEDIEDHAIGIAGLIPIQHIQNWEEIKHYYDKEEFIKEGTEFNTLSEYYEDDGYVEFIPDELEVEWVYGESDNGE